MEGKSFEDKITQIIKESRSCADCISLVSRLYDDAVSLRGDKIDTGLKDVYDPFSFLATTLMQGHKKFGRNFVNRLVKHGGVAEIGSHTIFSCQDVINDLLDFANK